MPGVITMYTAFADSHVARFENKGKPKKISRAKVEYQILREINNSDILIDCKLSWTHAILSSQLFDALWESINRRLRLPKACTARFVPDRSLIQFEAPSDDEGEERAKEGDDGIEGENFDQHDDAGTPALTNDHNSRQSSPDIVSSSSGSTTPQALLDRAAKVVPPRELAAQLAALPWCETCHARGHDSRSCPVRLHDEIKDRVSNAEVPTPAVRDEDSRAASIGADSSTHEENDATYMEASRPRKGTVKGKKSAKAASKPRGVPKNKAAPKKKLQTPAQLTQLMTAVAETHKPDQPKAVETPSATPGDTATTPARVTDHHHHNNSNKAAHPSTTPTHLAPASTPTTATPNPPAQPATTPDAIDQKLARIQANMAAAQAQGLKRMAAMFPADDDEDAPATKRAKTGGSNAAKNGGRKIATMEEGGRKKGVKSGRVSKSKNSR